MSSFSILGNDKGRSIAPLSLFDLIKEVGLALDELKGAKELELNRLLDSNKMTNAKDSKTNTQQESQNIESKADSNKQKAIHIVTLLEYILVCFDRQSGYFNSIKKIQTSNLELFNNRFVEIDIQKLDENIERKTKELNRLVGINIKKLDEIIESKTRDLFTQIANRMIVMNFSPDITFTLEELEEYSYKDYGSFSSADLEGLVDGFQPYETPKTEIHGNIESITKIRTMQNKEFYFIILPNNYEINGRNFKEIATRLLYTYKKYSKTQKTANINNKDSKTNAQQESQNTESKADSNKQGEIDTDTLITYTFTIDDNIMKDIEPKLSESFEIGIDIEQSTHKLFNQFENILIKNDDYNTYTTAQKQIATNLANIYKEVNKILLHFNDMIANDQGGLSPMQAKRFYIRSINQFIDSMKSINKDTIQPAKEQKKLDNPFMKDI